MMSPPRTRLKSCSDLAGISSASTASNQRKRKISETDMLSLMNQIDSLKAVCNNTFQIVEELKCTVDSLVAENIAVKTELCKLQDVNNQHLKKMLPSSASTSSKALYSTAVKSNPVVVIKPKDVLQTSSTIKKHLRENISPSKNTFRDVRNAIKGSVVIECDSVAGSNTLLKDATDKLGPNYVVTIPTKRQTKIRVLGMSEQLSSELLISKVMARQYF